jgi:NADH-quinone oxidoreductase subunit F
MSDERPLTGKLRADGEPLGLAEYERAGGYQALRKALRGMAPGDVTRLVGEASLRGRGGAGFPTGKKWSFVPTGEDAPSPRYVVANADEMEPGTFKDRVLMEGDPHQLVEGMALAAYAIGAATGYVFVRAEYPKSARRLERAIAEARERGYLGEDILGSGFSLELHVHRSSTRSREGARSRAPSRPTRRRPACGASRRWSTTSRRCATCPTSWRAAPNGSAAWA